MESLRVARRARYYDPYIWENGVLRNDLKSKYGPEHYTDFLIKFMEQSSKAQKPFLAYYSMALAPMSQTTSNNLSPTCPEKTDGRIIKK